MDSRRTARLAGIWFILTFVFSIPAGLFLYADVLDKIDYVVGPGADARIQLGAFLEILTAIANIATAVVRSAQYREYLHLLRTPGGWRIVDAFWQFTEPDDAAQS